MSYYCTEMRNNRLVINYLTLILDLGQCTLELVSICFVTCSKLSLHHLSDWTLEIQDTQDWYCQDISVPRPQFSHPIAELIHTSRAEWTSPASQHCQCIVYHLHPGPPELLCLVPARLRDVVGTTSGQILTQRDMPRSFLWIIIRQGRFIKDVLCVE